MNDAFERAFATLDRGACFLGGLLPGPWPERTAGPFPVLGPYRAKVIGNGLRELDRFLNLLVDEAAHALGRTVFPDQRNTANKLTSFCAEHGVARDDDARLRALGRSRECLFHCDGRVLQGDRPGGTSLTAGWPELPGTDAPLRKFAIGEVMVAAPEDLADVAAFYRRMAAEVRIVTCTRG